MHRDRETKKCFFFISTRRIRERIPVRRARARLSICLSISIQRAFHSCLSIHSGDAAVGNLKLGFFFL